MDNFDQFIKDNIENHRHDFKNRYWKSFARKAGFKTGVSAFKAALFSGAGILVLGAIAIVIRSGGLVNKNTISTPPQETIGFYYDTLNLSVETAQPDTITVDEVMVSRSETENIRAGQSSTPRIKTTVKETEEVKPVYRAKEKPVEKHKPTRMGRILTIDPDTIKTNF